jgi:hypothetical protein
LATLQEQLKKARLDLNRAKDIQKVKESYTKDTRYAKFDSTSDTGKTVIAELQAASKKVIEAQAYYDNLQAALAKQTAKEELTGAKKGVSEEVQAAKQGLTVEELRVQNQKTLDAAAAKKTAEQSTVTDQNQLNNYTQFRDTLADPANKQLLIDVQKDLKKNYPAFYKGGTGGLTDWVKTQAAIEAIYTARGGLPVNLRGTDLRTFIANPTIPGFGSASGTAPTTSLQVSDPTRAAGLIKSAFDSIKIGRDPTPEEIAQLTKDLNLAERKNPFKTINGVTTGGLDKNEFLIQAIQKLPAYAETLKVKSDKNKQALAATALANGLDLETNFGSQLPGWLDAANKGQDISKFQQSIRNAARRMLPESIIKQIDPEEDLSTTFSIYANNYAKAYGIPVNKVPLSKIIPWAVTDKGFASTIDFEKKKRSDPKWWADSVEAAPETATAITNVLKNFGFKGAI